MENLHVEIVDRSEAKLNVAAALEFVADPRFGGIANFVGRVREFNRDREVTGITYDLFEPLVLKTFREIGARTLAEVGAPLKLWIAHAQGDLGLGDPAVVVAAGTPHRDEAFRACRLTIEALKHEAPIWKQEHYADGDSAWSEGCSLCDEHREAERAAAGFHGTDHG
ncbi:MAG: molybdenum cofactor biosynthesis protein MoaE [Gammaproteobacteria bacterium]|nr:molybdenum cofactor biosynthesis protein MoaE [Gammaproteobacteria bacterium]